MGFCTNDGGDDESRENARALAKSGAQLGASAGSRLGPVSAGVASGLGGAVGYLAGTTVDGVQADIDRKPPLTDGGRSTAADSTAAAVEIPVTEE